MTEKNLQFEQAIDQQIAEKKRLRASLLREVDELSGCTASDLAIQLTDMRYHIERSRAILELCCDMYWDFYPDKALTIFSEGYHHLTGWDKLIYPSFAEVQSLVHPDDLEKFTDRLLAVTDGRQAGFNYEFRFRYKDGQYGWYNNRCIGIKNDDGKIIRVLGLINDLTAYRLQEAKLLEQQAINQLLVRTATDYIWSYDIEHKLFIPAQKLAEVLELTDSKISFAPGDLKRRSCELPNFIDPISSDIAEGVKINKTIQFFSRQKKAFIWFEIAYFPLKDAKGKFYKFIGTMYDISDKVLLAEAAKKDPLTGAHNRRAADEKLDQIYCDFLQTKKNSAILFLDIDDFKAINDIYGHPAGDFVLKELVSLINSLAEAGTSLYRWGGEEFVVICEDTDKAPALAYAERIRANVEQMSLLWESTSIHITISIGVSMFSPQDRSYNKVIARADKALYHVKNSSKNAVTFEDFEHLEQSALFCDRPSADPTGQKDLPPDSAPHLPLYFDALTGLLNRTSYVRHYSNKNESSLKSVGVIIADINGLRGINLDLGHNAGDRTVCLVATILKNHFPSASVYRFSGDEFVVIWENISRGDFIQSAQSLKTALLEIEHGVTIGYTWKKEDVIMDRLILNANELLIVEKQKFYLKNDSSSKKRRAQTIQQLQSRIASGYFHAYLQPVKDLRSGKFVSAEILVRMQHPEQGLIPPIKFIPFLEKEYAISYLDYFMFERALQLLTDWKAKNHPDISISVNLSRVTLLNSDLMEQLDEIHGKYDVPRAQVEFEITENMGEIENETIAAMAEKIRERGYHLALDDFGAKYANPALLSSIAFDVLKLDKTMINHVTDNQVGRKLIQSIIDFCHDIKSEVVAEGVETAEQYQLLERMNCDYAQGYLLARPMPPADFEKLVWGRME